MQETFQFALRNGPCLASEKKDRRVSVSLGTTQWMRQFAQGLRGQPLHESTRCVRVSNASEGA